MPKPNVARNFVAIAMVATLLSIANRSSATELNGVVVTGVALDRVASRHSAPPYPQEARASGIQADVRVRIQVENGKMVNVMAESGSQQLATYSSRWIRWHWQFKPAVSGVYFLPLSYKLAS
jgi:outer membrane biosynthesis protein TonB